MDNEIDSDIKFDLVYPKKNIVLGCMYIICIYLIEMLHIYIYKLDPLTWRLGGLLFATQRSMHVHVHALKTLVPIAFLSPSVLLSFLQHRLLTSVKFLARDIAVSINSSLTALVPWCFESIHNNIPSWYSIEWKDILPSYVLIEHEPRDEFKIQVIGI